MSRQKVEITDSFEAVDAEGNTHTLNVHTTFTAFMPASGVVQWTAGSKAIKMQNGNHVNMSSDGTLTDFYTGRVLKRL